MTGLPTQLSRIYALLEPGADVPIVDLFDALGVANRDPKTMQQFVGSYITRLNRRLKSSKKRVVPGRMKQTYTLRDD